MKSAHWTKNGKISVMQAYALLEQSKSTKTKTSILHPLASTVLDRILLSFTSFEWMK